MKQTLNRVAVVLTTLYFGSAAMAAQITVQYDGFVNGHRSGTIYGNGDSTGVQAGQFRFNVESDGGVYWDDTLNAFCIDATEYLVTNSSATYSLVSAGSSSLLDAGALSLIGQLYDSHAADLGSSLNDAAFQLALWEIIYDHETVLNLQDGVFSSSGFNSARGLAQGWLDGLVPGTDYTSSSFELYVLEPYNPQSNQALLVARAIDVPTPATLGLLGAGLFAIGALRRRRFRA